MVFPIDYSAYDGATGLTVYAKIFDVTNGAATFVENVHLTHLLNGTYFGAFTNGEDQNAYLAQISVYTDGSLAAVVSEYGPASISRVPDAGALALGQMVQNVSDSVSQLSNTVQTSLPVNLDGLTSAVAALDGENQQTAETLASLNSNVSQLLTQTVSRFRKGNAFSNFTFPLTLAGMPATGQTVTAKKQLDAGPQTPCLNPVREVGGGLYQIDLTDAELTADQVTLEFSASGADTRYFTIYLDA